MASYTPFLEYAASPDIDTDTTLISSFSDNRIISSFVIANSGSSSASVEMYLADSVGNKLASILSGYSVRSGRSQTLDVNSLNLPATYQIIVNSDGTDVDFIASGVKISATYTGDAESVIEEYTEAAKTIIDDYVTNTSEPEIDDYVTNTSKPEIDDYVANTSKPSLDDYVENTSKPEIDAYVEESLPSASSVEFGLGVGKISPPSSTGWTWNSEGTSATYNDWGVTLLNQNINATSGVYQDQSSEFGDGTSDWNLIVKGDGLVPFDSYANVGIGLYDSTNDKTLGVHVRYDGTLWLITQESWSYVDGEAILKLGDGDVSGILASGYYIKYSYTASDSSLNIYFSQDGLNWSESITSDTMDLDLSLVDSIYVICETSDVGTSSRVTQITCKGVSFTDELDELKVLVPLESE